MRTPVKIAVVVLVADAGDEPRLRAAASATPGWRCRSASARWSTPRWLLRRAAPRAAATSPAPGWGALRAAGRCATAGCWARCWRGPPRASTGSACAAASCAADRLARRLLAGAALLYFGALLATRPAAARSSRAAAETAVAMPLGRRSKLPHAARCCFEAPTALEYFASLVADDASLLAARGRGRDRPGRIPRARRAGGAGRDRRAGGAGSSAASPADAAPLQRLRLLNRFFFQELGFAGNVNDYYDPRNSYLHTRAAARGAASRSRWRVLYIELAHAGRAAGARRLVSRPLPGQAAHAAGRGGDRPVHRPVAVARGARRAARAYRRRQGLVGEFDVPLGLFLQAAPPREVHRAHAAQPEGDPPQRARTGRACSRCSSGWSILLPEAWEERRDRGLVHAELGAPTAGDRRPRRPTSSTRPTRRRPRRRSAERLAELRPRRRASRAALSRSPAPATAGARSHALQRPRSGASCSWAALAARRGAAAVWLLGAGAHAVRRRRGAGLCAASAGRAARGARACRACSR